MKNKKDRNYLVVGLIGIILWATSLVVFVALILNNSDQKAWVVGLLVGFIIIGALLNFAVLAHYTLIFFKEQAKKNEELKKSLEDKSVKDDDVETLVNKILNDSKNESNSKE